MFWLDFLDKDQFLRSESCHTNWGPSASSLMSAYLSSHRTWKMLANGQASEQDSSKQQTNDERNCKAPNWKTKGKPSAPNLQMMNFLKCELRAYLITLKDFIMEA